MCSAEMQASISRCRCRWRMREPPLPAASAAEPVACWPRVSFIAPSSADHLGLPLAVLGVSLSRTIARGHGGKLHHENDLASRPLAHHPAAPAVPADFLPDSIRLRLQDQLRGSRAAGTAVHGRVFLHARSRPAAVLQPRQLPLSADRRGVRRRLSVLAADRLLLDPDLPGARLPDGLRNRAPPQIAAGTAAADHHAAVLDLVPAARLRP